MVMVMVMVMADTGAGASGEGSGSCSGDDLDLGDDAVMQGRSDTVMIIMMRVLTAHDRQCSGWFLAIHLASLFLGLDGQ